MSYHNHAMFSFHFMEESNNDNIDDNKNSNNNMNNVENNRRNSWKFNCEYCES